MEEKKSLNLDSPIRFLRKRDYRFVRQLGEGGCGITLLLLDEEIDKYFVCKKYAPLQENLREQLFANFVREINLLYKVHHQNVVRIFSHFLYPETYTGFILMEFIEGIEIDEYARQFPDKLGDLFTQVIAGFAYLQDQGILHRDIRAQNLMVTENGVVKIIDLGFGKQAVAEEDFKKSIHINWAFESPEEFAESTYDFGTEVYFVGMLFQKLVSDNNLDSFEHSEALSEMCKSNPGVRIKCFSDVQQAVETNRFPEMTFSPTQLGWYRSFADAVWVQLERIHKASKYHTEIAQVRGTLSDVYERCALEEMVPDASDVLSCLIDGGYSYRITGFRVEALRGFLKLLKMSDKRELRAILASLHTRLDTVSRLQPPPQDDDVPF